MLVEISHWVEDWSLIQSQIQYLIFYRLSSLFISIIYLLYSSYICRTYMYLSVLGCSCLVWYCWWSTTWSVHSGYILSLGKLEGKQTWLCSLFLFFITPNNVKWHQFVKEYNMSSLLVQGFAENSWFQTHVPVLWTSRQEKTFSWIGVSKFHDLSCCSNISRSFTARPLLIEPKLLRI